MTASAYHIDGVDTILEIPAGVDPSALGPDTSLTGVHELMLYQIDTIARYAEEYRAKDLDRIKEITYGDPVQLNPLPLLAIIPDTGELTDHATGRRGRPGFDGGRGLGSPTVKSDVFRWRLYYEHAEGHGSNNAFMPVTRTLDYLRAMLLEHQRLRGMDGCGRVWQAWPRAWFIATFIEEDRGGNILAVRGAELEVEIQFTTERVTVDERPTEES